MKPHALRRMLWLGNLGLLAGVAAAGFHLLGDVHPATASVLERKPNHIARSYKKIIDNYDKKRQGQATWQPKPPVTSKEIHSIFLDKWSKPKRIKPHFPFVGPHPPEIAKEVEAVADKPKLPTGLITIGEPTSLIYAPPSHVMLFEFKSGASEAFGVGDWIREDDKKPERFKMLDVVAKMDGREKSYEVVYGVYENGKETKRDKLGFVNPPDRGGAPDIIRDFVRKATADVTAAGKAGKTGKGGDGKSEDGGATNVSKPFKPSDIVVVGEVKLTDAKPKVLKFGSNRRAVVFTEKTRRYFQGKNATKLAESIKTSPATSGGRTIGLRVTGFGKELNADVFDVRKGDILVSINGVPVRDRAGVVELVKRLPEDKLVTVVINRHGKEITYKVDPSDPRNRRRVRYFENVDVPGR